MKSIELVVFDMAGTTVNEDNVVYKTLQQAINKKQYNLSLDFVLEHGAGKEKHQAIKILQITDASKVIKAGDSIIDIEEGKNALCGITIGVTTGAHTRKQLALARPTYILDSLLELKTILEK